MFDFEKILREKAVTQTELARRVGMATQNLSRLIKSDDIKVSALLKLADALSMHPIDFFSEKYCSVKFDNTFSAVSDSTVIKSQQRTIENLSETIKNLTSK